ncbi:MAG TPA: M20/M25/M40 family metallo-hydrolase [Anaerolineae bacterium]
MDLVEMRALLEKLSNEFGPSGRERAVRNLIKEAIQDRVDRVEVDALGNLIAYKAGTGPEPRLRVMLDAHMDEVGFMITKVDKNGLLHFHTTGIDERLLPAKRVVIGDERVPGVVGAPVPHLQSAEQARRPLSANDLTIDIGATGEKQAGEKVKAGDYGTFATRFAVLSEDPAWPTVRGKAFDDRAGCAVLVAVLAETYPVDILAVFSTQEEVGMRGARVAGYRLEPDAVLALEGTICDDSPRPPDEDTTPVTRLGAGPAVTIMDRSFAGHPGILAAIREAAAAEGIAYQYKTPLLGATDSGPVHISRAGVPAGAVAVPCRYIHGPAAILNLNDLTDTVRLAGAFLRHIERGHLTRAS